MTPEGDVKWLFRKEACMHCTNAACVTVCPSGALYYNTEFKTVGMDRAKCIGCKECVAACPFEVPRYDSKTDKVYKCDMCESRISNKLEPACVKACPTGALKWGDKEDMLEDCGQTRAGAWAETLPLTAINLSAEHILCMC